MEFVLKPKQSIPSIYLRPNTVIIFTIYTCIGGFRALSLDIWPSPNIDIVLEYTCL